VKQRKLIGGKQSVRQRLNVKHKLNRRRKPGSAKKNKRRLLHARVKGSRENRNVVGIMRQRAN
jgi:hypothetical protein